ncbi:glycosyltransferase family 2 protein [uncultured Gemella sp.]|uniref:glycosyltransferase family 2 protein n=1 Tax=uncultured Gemella sp. TaxID=254352 RepID=UPI0028D1AB2C|nr:glycosyltransferase family 2 protein [uncultured Gemella sp.]
MCKLVSIIVPVYKVEQYLKRCMDSVLNQTYKNIEVILVDDGSPDNCPALCDEYAKIDSRVRVIHKENGGLSSARNVALDSVKGDYIFFVDSDDWLALDTLEVLNEYLEKDYDMISFQRTYLTEEKVVEKGEKNPKDMDVSQYIDASFLGRYDFFVTTKIFKTEVFNNVRFLEGRNYEDLEIMHRLFLNMKKVVGLDYFLYYYWKGNEGAITNTITMKNIQDHYLSANEIYHASKKYLEDRGKDSSNIVAWYKVELVQLYIDYLKSMERNTEIFNNIILGIIESRVDFNSILKQPRCFKYLLFKFRLLKPIIKMKYKINK